MSLQTWLRKWLSRTESDDAFYERKHRLENALRVDLCQLLASIGFAPRHADALVNYGTGVDTTYERRVGYGTQDNVDFIAVDVPEDGPRRLLFKTYVVFDSPTKISYETLLGRVEGSSAVLGNLSFEDLHGDIQVDDEADLQTVRDAFRVRWLPLLQKTSTAAGLYEFVMANRHAESMWNHGNDLLILAHSLRSPHVRQHEEEFIKDQCRHGPAHEQAARELVEALRQIEPIEFDDPALSHSGEDDSLLAMAALRKLVKIIARTRTETRSFSMALEESIRGGNKDPLGLLRDAAEPAIGVLSWRGEVDQNVRFTELINAFGKNIEPMPYLEDVVSQIQLAQQVARNHALELIMVDTGCDMYAGFFVREDLGQTARMLLGKAGLGAM